MLEKYSVRTDLALEEKKAIQVIVEGDTYQVKYPIYDILNQKKRGQKTK